MAEQQQNSLETLKQNLVEYVKLQLGDQIIDIEERIKEEPKKKVRKKKGE